MRYFFTVLMSLFSYNWFSIKLLAQSSIYDNLYINAKYYYGFVLPEYSSFLYVVNEPVKSFSLSIHKQSIGKNIWQQLYNYPESGITLFYTTLGNNEVNGTEFAIYPYTNLHLFSRKNLTFKNTIGIGLSYTTKHFDPQTNYSNIAVGSHVNIHFNFKLGLEYMIKKRFAAELGLSFDHLSNANLREPNIGINNFTAYTGASYLLGKPLEKQKMEYEKHQKTLAYELIYSVGGKHARALSSQFFFTSSISADVNWKITRGFHIGAGADLFYDTSAETEMKSNNKTYTKGDDYSSGVHMAQHVVYNRLSIILQEGLYVFLPNKSIDKFMYNRGIIKYQITPSFSMRISMKSHLHILDYPELGAGITW